MKLFLLLAVVTVALLAAEDSFNHVRPMHRFRQLPGEREPLVNLQAATRVQWLKQ